MTMEGTQNGDAEGVNRVLLEQQICFRVYVASNLVTRLYRLHLDAMGLTYPQYLVMLILWETELQSVSRERPFDIAFVCVKSYDTAWATMMVSQYLAPGGFVVSLQNCMNEETIAGIVGWGRTVRP